MDSNYKERLIRSFPKNLHSDVNEVLKILPFENNELKLTDGNILKVDDLIHERELNVAFDNETLTIPYRLYFNEPNPALEKSLTGKQRDIFALYLFETS